MGTRTRKLIYRLTSIFLGTVLLFALSTAAFAQETETEASAETEVAAAETEFVTMAQVEEMMAAVGDASVVQGNLDQVWILIAGFLVFFMQAGFAMLEGGFIRHTGVVNSLAENFMDACVTGIMFFIVGFGIAYGSTLGAGTYESGMFLLDGIDGTVDGNGVTFIDFFFQFAFAGAAATIATGAMAERTNFIGKLVYSALLGAFLYPVVVHWTWGGGLLASNGFVDFAGSTIVHQFGGIMALMGAIFVGPRVGRAFGSPPRPSNMGLAALGTFILWFGWYGFNVGSTLGAGDVNALGLVATNTTLAASAGALGAMFFQYFRTSHWDLGFILNGSLAGLVGITAGCAFVSPIAAIVIGITAGVVVVLSVNVTESLKVDDAVGAFAVHGACGALGSLAIGFWGIGALIDPETAAAGGDLTSVTGILAGGGFDLLLAQLFGVVVVAAWAAVTGGIMFGALRALNLLRMPTAADVVGIDVYEHNASVWPDVLPIESEAHAGEGSPAIGD
jgi:ammonium transporter, Amt family